MKIRCRHAQKSDLSVNILGFLVFLPDSTHNLNKDNFLLCLPHAVILHISCYHDRQKNCTVQEIIRAAVKESVKAKEFFQGK